MNAFAEIPVHSLQPFAPDPELAYPIETIAHLANVPRHLVLLCCRHGLVAPEVDPEYGGYRFTGDAIRTLRRVDYLHADCGINFPGIRIILGLMDELDRLRGQLGEA